MKGHAMCQAWCIGPFLFLCTSLPLSLPVQVSFLLATTDHESFRLWIKTTVEDEQKSTCERRKRRKRGRVLTERQCNEREGLGQVHQGISLQLVKRKEEGGGWRERRKEDQKTKTWFCMNKNFSFHIQIMRMQPNTTPFPPLPEAK